MKSDAIEVPSSQVRTEAATRAKAFAHLDEAKLGWFHLRAVIVAGVGFFADSYDIFVISQSVSMIYQVYFANYITGSFPANMPGYGNQTIPKTGQNTVVNFKANYPNGKYMDAWLKASTNWGNFVGQLGFGILGDKLGRKKMYGVELIIMIVATFGSCMCAPMAYGWDIVIILSLWRFILGIGIGGDYPMSAVITSEFANVRYRGMMIAAVFSMQGVGILMGAIVVIATLAGMQSQIQANYMALDIVWRVVLGFGVVPALFAIYFRLTIPETPRYTVDVIGDTAKADNDVEKVLQMNGVSNVTSNWNQDEVATAKVVVKQNSWSEFRAYFGQRKNALTLFGTAYTWFALDVAFYGLSLNSGTILGLINYGGALQTASVNGKTVTLPADIWNYFYNIAIGNLIIAFCGQIPGYIFTVLLIEKMGRKTIQFMGFAIVAICLAILAGLWTTISTNAGAFLAVYTVAQFFQQFGPNTTTFVVPSEVFPTRFRSTAHGFSAAMGKLGAIIGIQVVTVHFSDSADSPRIVLAILAAVCVTGFFATFCIPEPMGKTLEELSGEEDVIVG